MAALDNFYDILKANDWSVWGGLVALRNLLYTILCHKKIFFQDEAKLCLGTTQLRNKLDIWNVHGIMSTSGFLQSKCSPTLQETRCGHVSVN